MRGFLCSLFQINAKNCAIVCGKCRGDLLPLFETRTRKTNADGRLESDKKRGKYHSTVVHDSLVSNSYGVSLDSPTFLDKFLAPSAPVGTPSRLRVVGFASDNTDAMMNLDDDDVVEISPPSKNKGMLNPSLTMHTVSNKIFVRKEPGNTDHGISGLIKHLSIIDLTED